MNSDFQIVYVDRLIVEGQACDWFRDDQARTIYVLAGQPKDLTAEAIRRATKAAAAE